MKKLLEKLESMVELKLVEADQSKSVYGGSYAYDSSDANDSSTYYDHSTSYDNSHGFDS